MRISDCPEWSTTYIYTDKLITSPWVIFVLFCSVGLSGWHILTYHKSFELTEFSIWFVKTGFWVPGVCRVLCGWIGSGGRGGGEGDNIIWRKLSMKIKFFVFFWESGCLYLPLDGSDVCQIPFLDFYCLCFGNTSLSLWLFSLAVSLILKDQRGV